MSDQIAMNLNLFPDKIITELLIRLPAKDVSRCKTVSKRWNAIICNPHFVASYISYCNPDWLVFNREIGFTTGSGSGSGSATQFNLSPRPGISTLTLNPALISGNQPVLTDYPSQIYGSSNGLVLCGLAVSQEVRGPSYRNCSLGWNQESKFLFVANPGTREWAPIPEPDYLPIDMQFGVGFASRVDPGSGLVDKFVVVEYQHLVQNNTAILQCFSSDTGKWVVKNANYMLPPHHVHPFRPFWGFEFDGRLFWVEYSVGMITWDVKGDIFTAAEAEGRAKCRLIPLPNGREARCTTPEMMFERRFGGVAGGRSMQYVELFKKSECMLKCWRLKDYKSSVSGWSLLYKLSRADVQKCLGCASVVNLRKVKILGLHPPFEPDSVILCAGDTGFSFNFRTRKIEGCRNSNGWFDCIPVVMPRWPVSLPPRLYAVYKKEEGNAYFKEGKFTKAIESYTESVVLSPNVVAYANRAAAYIKVNAFYSAEDDCTEALKIDSNYFKAYARRAIARKELGNLEGSKEDAELAVKLEPNNQEMRSLSAHMKSLLNKGSPA